MTKILNDGDLCTKTYIFRYTNKLYQNMIRMERIRIKSGMDMLKEWAKSVR